MCRALGPDLKVAVDDAVMDSPEVALPRSVRRQLNKAQGSFSALQECLNSKVDVSEVYSPPRVTKEVQRQGLRPGNSYDILSGFDLRVTKDVMKMWRELRRGKPELTIGSSPCTPFSPVQAWNWPRMEFARAVQLLGGGLGHWTINCQVAKWQYDQGRIFLVEHPLPSKAWDEPCAQELMALPGVYVVTADLCAYGLRVATRLNKKATQFVTNSRELAAELSLRCSGGSCS